MVVFPDPVFHSTVECRVGKSNIHSWWHQPNEMEHINSIQLFFSPDCQIAKK